ncbi:MAG TPA: hypothetical protein VFN67_21615 [Polyangiales bacterium]|nr:hypothetical protein [Polyangiales bacterium]
MNTAQHHATIIATLTTLGLALSACTSCPVGTQPVDGVCMRVSKTSADGAAGASSPGEATDQEDPGSANSDGIAGIGRASDAQVAACAGNAGEAACDEQGTLLMCDDHGAAKRIAACMSAELCEAGRSYGKCAACLPGAAKCDGAMLMRCSADASTFAAESDCKSAQLCDQVRGTCLSSACEADAYSCDGDRLNVCKPDLTGYQFAKQCPPGLCDAGKKGCKQCKPGAMSCDGATLMTCDGLGEHLEVGAMCEGQSPICDESRGCVECKATSDCKAAHDCADLTGCSAGVCQYAAKMRRTAVGDGSLVREGNPDPDPIYVVFGGALFYISSEDEVNSYGGFAKVQIKPLSYARCPVPGTLITERGDSVGYIYVSDGKQLNSIKSQSDLEMYCGGSASIVVVPAGSLTTTTYSPPAGLCPVNKN